MKISKVLLPLLLVLSLLAGCGAPAETASAPAEGEAAATGGGQVVLIISTPIWPMRRLCAKFRMPRSSGW